MPYQGYFSLSVDNLFSLRWPFPGKLRFIVLLYEYAAKVVQAVLMYIIRHDNTNSATADIAARLTL